MKKEDFINYIKELICLYEDNYKEYTAEQMRNEIKMDLESIIRLIQLKKIEY